MPHECVLCMEVDSEENPLLELPCFSHWVCSECIPAYFVNATNNESLFPPQCCEEPIPIENYEEYIPVSVKLAYDLKEQGEYTILPKYRVYCAGEACGKFVHPSGHIEDKESNVTYAICDYCFQGTCCACKTLLIDDIQDHVCRAQESNEEFKEFADKEGYKDCFACGATVELAEACNHITCECGNQFCYVCGRHWDGSHGCPEYGPATYDADGYNEAGYHRDTGLNREGRTHSEEGDHMERTWAAERDRNNGEDNEEEGEPEVENILQRVMNRLEPDQRAMIESLDEETRDEALLQIMDAWVDQGIVLDLPQTAQPQPQNDEEDANGGDDAGNSNDDEGDENADDNEGVQNPEGREVDEFPGADPNTSATVGDVDEDHVIEQEAPAPWHAIPGLLVDNNDTEEEHTVEHEAPIIWEPVPEPMIDISDADQEHVVEHEGPVIWEPAPELRSNLSEDPGL